MKFLIGICIFVFVTSAARTPEKDCFEGRPNAFICKDKIEFRRDCNVDEIQHNFSDDIEPITFYVIKCRPEEFKPEVFGQGRNETELEELREFNEPKGPKIDIQGIQDSKDTIKNGMKEIFDKEMPTKGSSGGQPRRNFDKFLDQDNLDSDDHSD